MKKRTLTHAVCALSLAAGIIMAGKTAWADENAELKAKVQALQNRVDQLEAQSASGQQAGFAPGTNALWADPFMQMMQMQRRMNQAFANMESVSPYMDMRQTDKEYIITMDLPGMDKDKMNIELKGRVLTVSGQRQVEKETSTNNAYYQGRSYGSFMQAIPLPKDAKKDQIEAAYNNGVLTVKIGRIPKQEQKPEHKRIMVK